MGSPAFLLSLFVSIEWLQGVMLPERFSASAGPGWQREIQHADCGNVLKSFYPLNKKFFFCILVSLHVLCVCVCVSEAGAGGWVVEKKLTIRSLY